MEEWRDIEGYEGLYQVSNMGRVKSFEKRFPNPSNAEKEIVVPERIMKPVDRGGYPSVTLYKDRKPKQIRIHRLVAQAFIDNPEGLREIDHIDRDKTNNKVENLRWATRSENVINRKAYSNTGEKYIHKMKYFHKIWYMFTVQRGNNKHQKKFKTLEEAIAYRDSLGL